MFHGERAGQSFDFDRWELHRSSSRYTRLLEGVVSSVTARRILPTVAVFVAWSAAVDIYNANEHVLGLPEVELPLTPFDLTAPVLALLLVFRSNTAFERFDLGSEATWEITGCFKSIVRQLLSYTAGSHFGPDERAAAYELAEACLVLHGFLMTTYLRGKNEVGNDDEAAIILRKALALPPPRGEGAGAASAADDGGIQELLLGSSSESSVLLTPSAGIAAITIGMARRLPSLDPQEATQIESQFESVVSSVGTCEKLLRTPIPLGYTRYSVRFLCAWLALLPFALVRTFVEFGTNTWWEDKPKPVLVFAMMFIGYIFLSIEDISVQIEEPFCVLPLELHQQWLKREFKQMLSISRMVDNTSMEKETEANDTVTEGTSFNPKKQRRRIWRR